MQYYIPQNKNNLIDKNFYKKNLDDSNIYCINETYKWKDILYPKLESKEILKKNVEMAHLNRCLFNYIFNPTCMGNLEFTNLYHKKILDHLELIEEIGVDYITINIPFILEIVLTNYKRLTPILSISTDLDCIQKIDFYEKMGVKEFIIPADTNRDFKMLEKLGKKTKSIFHLILNNTSLYKCAYHRSHINNLSHCMNDEEKKIVNESFSKCKIITSDEFIKSRWIRPEDIDYYVHLGFNNFHITGDDADNAWLQQILNAYQNKKYDGNLMKLLSPLNANEISNIDNTKFPKDFVQKYKEINCRITDCADCRYCEKIAKEVKSLSNVNVFKMKNPVAETAGYLL